MNRSRAIRRILIIAAIILVALYAAFEARALVRGPIITIENPPSGTTVTESFIRITGTAKNIHAITMNGRAIFISEGGKIDEPVVLLAGGNEILFIGTDRFGKETRLVLPILYKPSREAPLFTPSSTTGTTTEEHGMATSSS